MQFDYPPIVKSFMRVKKSKHIIDLNKLCNEVNKAGLQYYKLYCDRNIPYNQSGSQNIIKAGAGISNSSGSLYDLGDHYDKKNRN